jgi:hypothetical protein
MEAVMMDPSGGGGIGKAAQELMQEMQKAQQEMQQKSAQTPGGPNEAFQNAMHQAQAVQPTNQVQGLQPTNQINAATQASNVLMQAKLTSTSPSTRVGEAGKAQRSRMAEALDSMCAGQDKMNDIMKLALSGKQFNGQELLAMQAGVYRFSQELDLTGKVVDKATSGIKQTMNTQV